MGGQLCDGIGKGKKKMGVRSYVQKRELVFGYKDCNSQEEYKMNRCYNFIGSHSMVSKLGTL